MAKLMINIPCCHDFFPIGKRIDVVFKYRVFERCTFVVDDDNKVVTPYHPYNHGDITTLSINPFCPGCIVELTELFVLMSYSEVECSKILKSVRNKLNENFLSRSQLLDQDSVEDDLGCTFGVTFYRQLTCTYSEETVRLWVERVSSNEVPSCTPASDEAIDALERITATTTSTTRCAICLEELIMLYNKGEVGRRLPCKHEFHGNCILKWLHTSHYCPLCRFELPTSSSSSSLSNTLWFNLSD